MSIDELQRLALRYIDRSQARGDLRTPSGAKGRCSIVSGELVDEYVAAGYDACRIRFKGHRDDVPVPHPEGDCREEHLAVLVDGVVVDATRRQFDPSADVPTIYASIDAAGCHWREMFEEGVGLRTAPLPAP